MRRRITMGSVLRLLMMQALAGVKIVMVSLAAMVGVLANVSSSMLLVASMVRWLIFRCFVRCCRGIRVGFMRHLFRVSGSSYMACAVSTNRRNAK
uniref:Uncharacterized protein n=1 Tax=Anopheles darlingi TaxID=43151 RepID=A0A2M4DBG2_ANODA